MTSQEHVATHETIIPNVIRLPSIIMKLPRFAADEHSAWYDGTVEVCTVVSVEAVG